MNPLLLALAKPLVTLVSGAFFYATPVYDAPLIGEGVEPQFEAAEVPLQLEKRVPAKPDAPAVRAEKPEDE